MNEQAIIDSYNLFVQSGYKKSLQEFKQLLASNPEAVNDSYGLFQQNGYKKSIDEYKTLMGIGATVESPMAVAEEPKKKGVMASPFVDGGLEPTKFDPRTGQVVQETPQQVTPEFKPLEGPFKPGEGIKYTEQDFDSKVQKQKVPTPQSYWNIFSKTIADLPSDVGESWAVASAFIERQLGKAGVPGANPNLTARDIHTYQLADDWRKYTDEVFPTNQEDRSTFLGGVVSGLGQVVPMVMSGGISNVSKAKAAMDIAKTALSTGTKLTPFINMGKDIAKQAASPTGLIGGSQVSSAMYRQAIDSGATEDQAQQYAIENFFVGTVAESLPMQSMFSRMLKIEPTANILRILKEGAVGAAEEFTTEMWQTTYENWSAQRIYDFNREMLDGVGEAGAVGGTVGFILNTALAALVGRRARVKNEEEGKILDKSIEEVKSKINTVNKNNEDISTVAEELNSIEPIVLNYGDSKYFFARDKSGRMELAEEPMLEDQAKSMSNMLGKVYKGLEFSIEEVRSNDPYAPVKYNVIARERGAKQEVPTYKVDGKDVTVESIDELIKTKSKEELLAMNIEINNDQTGITERLQAAVETKPADNQKRKERIVELNNLLASDAASLQDTGTGNLIPEARQEIQQELETLKAEEDAIQKQAAGQVPVQPGTGVSQEVAQGEPQAEPQGVTQEGQEKINEIEKRRQQELKERVVFDRAPTVEDGEFRIVGDPSKRIFRINQNTGRPQVLDESNGLWSNDAMPPNMFMETTKRSGFEKLKENINAKYDAEVAAIQPQVEAAPIQQLDIEGEVSRLEQLFAEQETTPTQDTGISISNDTDVEELRNKTQSRSQQATTQKEKNSAETKVKIIDTAKKAINTLKSIFPDVDIVIHDDEGSYNAVMAEVDGVSGSRGNFFIDTTPDGKTTGRIDINLSKANSRTVAHEIAHGILLKTFGDNKNLFNDFRTRLSKILNGNVNQKLNNFADKYVDRATGKLLDVNHEEFLAELTGVLEQQETNISVTTMQKVAALINEFISKITGGKFKPFEDTKNTKDVVDFFNTISGAIREGKGLEGVTEKINKNAEPTGTNVDTSSIKKRSSLIEKLGLERFSDMNQRITEGITLNSLGDIISHLTFSDRLVTGRVGNKDYLGGILFAAATNRVWASFTKGRVSQIISGMPKNEDGYRYLMPALLTEGAHMSNKDMSNTAIKLVEDAISNGDISPVDADSRIRKALNRKGLESFSKLYSDTIGNNKLTPELVISAIDNAIVKSNSTFEDRNTFLESLLGKADIDLKKRFGTLPSYNVLANGLAEPITNRHEFGDILLVIRTKGDLVAVQPKEGDPDYHPSYPWVIRSVNPDGSIADVETLIFDQSYNAVNVFPEVTNKQGQKFTYQQYVDKYGEGAKSRYLGYMGARSAMSTSVTEKIATEAQPKSKIVSKSQLDEATPKSKRVSRSQIIGEDAELEGVVRHNLGVAKILSREGVSPERVKLFSMGWELGSDGKWRYEIPDGKFKENIDISRPSKLEDIFDAPDLFKAYPEARNIEVEFKLLPENEGGNFDPSTKSIIINRSRYKNDKQAAELTMLHEIQHWIQVKELFQGGSNTVAAKFKMDKIVDYFEKLVKKRESIYDTARLFYADNQEVVKEAKDLLDFAKGQYDILKELTFEKGTKEEKVKAAEMIKNLSEYAKRGIVSAQNLIDELSKKNPADAFNLYYRVAGEVEARNVEYRNKLTPSQRRNILLSDTENIDREDQIMLDSFGFVFEANQMKDEFRVSRSQLDDQDRINKLINEARSQGFSEEAIVLFLQRKGLTDNAIDTAMAKAEPAAKKVEVTEEFAPGYDRMITELEGVVEKSLKRGTTQARAMENAINYLQGTKVYENATDVQREQMVRDVNKRFKKRQKSAPTAKRVLGQKKDVVTVTVDLAKERDRIIKEQIKLAKEVTGDLNQKRAALAENIKPLIKGGIITAAQARTIINRISKVNLNNPIMVDKLIEYIDKVFDNANYAAEMDEIRKLQAQAKSRNHTSMKNLVDRFTSINPELIPLVDKETGEPLNKIMEYKEALDFLNNLTPSYAKMSEMLPDIESYKVTEKFDSVKTIDDIKEKYKGVSLNKVESVEEYVALIKDINSIKRKLNQLLDNGSISPEEYDIQITIIGEDQSKVEKKYAVQISKIKKDLIAEIKKQRPTRNPEFTNEENDLIKEYLELSDADLESLSPEDLFILNDLLENISNGEIDVSRFGPIVSKAKANDNGDSLASQLEESKIDMSYQKGREKLSEFESSFWEGLLGLGRVTSGALQKFIVSPFNRSIGSYEKFLRDGFNEFLKLKKKYKIDRFDLLNESKGMKKIGMLTTYLQEYMAQFDPNNEGIKDIGNRDWFKQILNSESMRGDYPEGDPSFLKNVGIKKTELQTIESIWNSLPKDANGNVDPKAVYDSYMANDGKFFTKREKAFFDELMEWKKNNVTSKQKYANELKGNPFNEIPFHMLRSRYGGDSGQITPTVSAEDGVVRIKAGTGKERVSEKVGAINTDFQKLFIIGLEQTGRDYFLSKGLIDINNTLSAARKKLAGKKESLMKTISYTLSDALAYEFDMNKSQMILSALLSAKAIGILLDPIKTAYEFTSTLLSYPIRSKTPSGYKNLFGSQKDMRKLLEFTESPLRLRQNINTAIDIIDGNIEPQGIFMKATNYLSGLPERTMMVTSWMPTFTNEFQRITGEKFDMKKFNDSEAYREKYGKTIRESAAVADAQTEKIIGPTTKAGQRRQARLVPEKIANIFNKRGTVSRSTPTGQILAWFSNYPFRESTEFGNGFRESAEVLQKSQGVLKSLSQLSKPLGISINLATYGFLASATYALTLMSGDDEDEERGEKLLDELMTVKGFIDELTSNAISLAGSKYAAGGKAMLQLGATIGMLLTDDEEQQARIKKILKNSVYLDPLPTQKMTGYGDTDKVISAISKYIPQFVMMGNLYIDLIGTKNEVKAIYDKIESDGIESLTQDEGQRVLALNSIMNSIQLMLNIRGLSLPAYNKFKTYMRGVKEEAGVSDVYKGEAPAKKKSSGGGGGGRAKTINKSDLKKYYPELSRQIESATGEVDDQVKEIEKEQRELKKKIKDQVYGD